MVDYNIKNLITKLFFFPTYIVQFQSIFVSKKLYVIMYEKMQIYSKIDWSDF
jgi:hypothetical protein